VEKRWSSRRARDYGKRTFFLGKVPAHIWRLQRPRPCRKALIDRYHIIEEPGEAGDCL
jgi:hypothetical protein